MFVCVCGVGDVCVCREQERKRGWLEEQEERQHVGVLAAVG